MLSSNADKISTNMVHSFILLFLCEDEVHIHIINHLKTINSVAFSTCIMLCKHHFSLLLNTFITPEEYPTLIK